MRAAAATPGHTQILLWRKVVMRRVCLPGLAGLLGLALLAVCSAFAADQPATPKADAVKKTETKTTETTTKTETHTANKPVAGEAGATEKARGHNRLPMHFGRIGLTPEQRQQMKSIEAKYAGEIKDLETKLRDVCAKQTSELHALLSEAQKKALAEAKAAAAQIREKRKEVTEKAMAAGAERVQEVRAQFDAR